MSLLGKTHTAHKGTQIMSYIISATAPATTAAAAAITTPTPAKQIVQQPRPQPHQVQVISSREDSVQLSPQAQASARGDTPYSSVY